MSKPFCMFLQRCIFLKLLFHVSIFSYCSAQFSFQLLIFRSFAHISSFQLVFCLWKHLFSVVHLSFCFFDNSFKLYIYFTNKTINQLSLSTFLQKILVCSFYKLTGFLSITCICPSKIFSWFHFSKKLLFLQRAQPAD